MARPRFLFLSGCSWATGSAADRRGQLWYSWRLVSANNRPLATSWGDFSSLPDCHQAVDLLTQRLHEGDPGLVADMTNGLWSWRFEIPGQRLALSARNYQRQRECRYNADAFLAAVPLATASTHVLTLTRGRSSAGFRPPVEDDDLVGLRRALSLR